MNLKNLFTKEEIREMIELKKSNYNEDELKEVNELLSTNDNLNVQIKRIPLETLDQKLDTMTNEELVNKIDNIKLIKENKDILLEENIDIPKDILIEEEKEPLTIEDMYYEENPESFLPEKTIVDENAITYEDALAKLQELQFEVEKYKRIIIELSKKGKSLFKRRV